MQLERPAYTFPAKDLIVRNHGIPMRRIADEVRRSLFRLHSLRARARAGFASIEDAQAWGVDFKLWSDALIDVACSLWFEGYATPSIEVDADPLGCFDAWWDYLIRIVRFVDPATIAALEWTGGEARRTHG